MDDETIKNIDKIIRSVSRNFNLGYLQADDIQQECWVHALEILDSHDPEVGSLATFLSRSLHNHLCNMYREMVRRTDLESEALNIQRASLSLPGRGELFDLAEPSEQKPWGFGGESPESLRNGLDPSLQQEFLRMLEGVQIPPQRQRIIIEAIRNLAGASRASFAGRNDLKDETE